jgi:2-alkenal reductase
MSLKFKRHYKLLLLLALVATVLTLGLGNQRIIACTVPGSGASAGIGFAVSANTASRVVPRLIEQGYFPHPWLGADMFSLSPSTFQILRDAGVDLPVDSGLLVLDTAVSGPAETAGIRGGSQMLRIGRYRFPAGGDVIVAVDGEPIDDLETLTVYLETETSIGDTVDLTIRRGDQELTVPVTLEEQPRDS